MAPMLQRLRDHVRKLWHWSRQESDLDEEIAFHLSEEEDERIAEGLAPDHARASARKDFGNVARIREDTRDTWAWTSAERLIQDVRFGLRTMRRQPSVAIVAVVTLTLGLGATTAVLTVINGLILRPLPLRDARQLLVLYATTPKRGVFRDTTSFLDFSAWKSQSHSFTGVAAFRQDPFNITGDGTPEPIRGVRASHEFLSVLGVSPAIGRSFTAEEQHDKRTVALISHRLWTRRYGSDPNILGRTILLNEIEHVVVGVLPAGFEFPPFIQTDVIVPVPERQCRSCGYIRAIGRLQHGVPRSVAQQDLDAIARRLEKSYPESNGGRGVNAVPLHDVAVGDVRTPLLVLLGAGVLVLLIGCANVGHLVLAKGIARQRELAVRSALGAGRGRLMCQLLTESVTLAILAAVFGAVLARWGSGFLVASLAQQYRLPDLTFNWTFLVFAISIAIVCGFLSGLPPALRVWRPSLGDFLKQDSRTQSSGLSERRLGRFLIAGQTALTVLLLIGAALLLKSFLRLQHIDLGVNTQQALTADLLLSKRYADPIWREAYLQQLLDSIGGLPGVQAVGIHIDQPFMGGGQHETFKVQGHPDPGADTGHPAAFNVVSGDFFRAMDISLLEGRPFNESDTAGSMPVAIVNEAMARKFWSPGQAIGEQLQFYYEKDRRRWLTIVGVVRDVRYHGRLHDPVPQVFVPSRQPFYDTLEPLVSIVVRTSVDPVSLENAVRARIWAVDKDQPISNLQRMDRVLEEAAAAPRVYMLLFGAFAAIALVIASAGIYGASAYAVVRRTHEMGIRLALGATPAQALVLVMRQGLLLTLIGAGIGVAGALAFSRVISGFLQGIAATDAVTYATAIGCFTGVAIVSTYIPARRVTAIDPTVALRAE
jgi:putative ABC transport system permease protein